MSRTFGAPLGAVIPLGKSGVDSLAVRSILPLKGGSGRGSTSCAETERFMPNSASAPTIVTPIRSRVRVVFIFESLRVSYHRGRSDHPTRNAIPAHNRNKHRGKHTAGRLDINDPAGRRQGNKGVCFPVWLRCKCPKWGQQRS